VTVCQPALKKVKTAVRQFSTKVSKSVSSLHHDLFVINKVSIALHKD